MATDEQDLVEAIQTALLAATWPSSSDKIFGAEAVAVTPAVPLNVVKQMRMPAAFIRPLGGTADQDEPFLLELQVGVTVVNQAYGDQTGQFAVLGGHTYGDKGLLIICRQVIRTIGKLLKEDGVPIRCVTRTAAQAIHEEDSIHYVYRDLLFSANVSMQDES